MERLISRVNTKLRVKKMEKAVEMGKTSTTGSFQLFIGRIASTLVLAVGTIIVGMFALIHADGTQKNSDQ